MSRPKWEMRELSFDTPKALYDAGVKFAFQTDSMGVNIAYLPYSAGLAVKHGIPDEQALKAIAMFRLVCPDAEIKVCAGREHHLGAREKDLFAAGATGMMIGGYLTVRGRAVEQDLRMIREAGLDT